MELILADAETLSHSLYEELGRYRRHVFVEKLGWKLDTPEGLERDQFDRRDTVHVIARSAVGIVGCARLLPTTGPYLLSEVFPQLMNGEVPPCSPEVWELSRFAVLDPRGQHRGASQVPSALAIEILSVAAAYVAAMEGRRMITVSPLAMERLLRKTGFHTHRAGPPSLVDGHLTLACWIEIDEQTDPQKVS